MMGRSARYSTPPISASASRQSSPRVRGGRLKPLAGFSLYGPTCDSDDHMKGPFLLPECVREGDYIEIGQLGAYGRVLANRFNGFGEYDEVILTDEPMLSMLSRP